MRETIFSNTSQNKEGIHTQFGDLQPVNVARPTFIFAILFATIITAIFVYSIIEQPRMVASVQHEQERIKVLGLAFREKIGPSSMTGEAKNAETICIGSSRPSATREFDDPPASLLHELGKYFPKILPYSRCQEALPKWPIQTYLMEGENWQPNGDVYVGVAYHDGSYGNSLTYHFQKNKGKWEIVDSYLNWIR